MKRITALLSLAGLVLGANAMDEGAVWSTAVSTRPSDGHRIVYRYKSEFSQSFERTNFPDRIILTWRYGSPSGMPESAEREAMDRFEDLLAPAVESSSEATLVIVSTGDNLREWTYYARSQEDFMARMSQSLRNSPRFPVEISLHSDPAWKTYEDFRKTVQK